MSIIDFTTSSNPLTPVAVSGQQSIQEKSANDVAVGIGIGQPLTFSKRNDYKVSEGSRLLTNQVIFVLSTRATTGRFPGDLPSNPTFGSLVWTLKHRQADDTTLSLARVFTRRALSKWIPELEVLAMNVLYPEGTTTLRIELFFKHQGAEESPISLAVNVQGVN